MFWRKKQRCQRCGKVISDGIGSGKVTSGTPVTLENTGETLCADCAMKALGDMMPEESSPAIEKFLEDTIKIISLKADVDPVLFTAQCKTIVTSDVEICKTARGYDLTLYKLLMIDPQQTDKVVDYVVNWIREHPLEVNALTTKCIGPQQLGDGGLFVFLFIPASRPFPDGGDITYMSNQIAPGFSPSKLGWRVLSLPQDTGPENHAFIADAVQAWSFEQSDSKGIEVASKPVETEAGRKLVCLVAYREMQS